MNENRKEENNKTITTPPPTNSKHLLFWIISIAITAILALSFMTSTIVLSVNNKKIEKQDRYDFYVTFATLPTLYATINAYTLQNPNTYMWFHRGNTISYEHSAPFIHYFSSQSQTNANSSNTYGPSNRLYFLEMREKVRSILHSNPNAKFHLYCDDIHAQYILDIFVAAGVEFESLNVTLLSDGGRTYNEYANMTEEKYLPLESNWKKYLSGYLKNKNNLDYINPEIPIVNALWLEEGLTDYPFYLSTFPNVNYWIQYPEYLENTKSKTLNKDRYTMNIVKKSPRAMYDHMPTQAKDEYQRVVLANALVDNDNLHTLDDAVKYYDDRLNKTDKEVVLLLGTNKKTLNANSPYFEKTIEYYTPTITSGQQVKFKDKLYTTSDNKTIMVNDKQLDIGKLGVHLYFKSHPAHLPETDLKQYFEKNSIEMLPPKMPVEILCWMYNVKIGGYQTTVFLSCDQGQVDFFYSEGPEKEDIKWKDNATKLLYDQGFFKGTKIIYNDPIKKNLKD